MMKLVLSWFGLHSMQHAFTQFHALLLQFPRNLMKFMDIPTIYNFIQVFPILLTIAFLGIGLRLVWYLLWSSCLTSKTTNFYDGIPAVPGIPFIGIAHRLFTVNNKTDIHYEALRLVQEYGPLMQFDLFGKHFVMVNDGTLARQVLDEVRGKGSFQVSYSLF